MKNRLIVAGLVFAVLLGWALTQERGRKVEKGEAFGLDATAATRLQVKSETSTVTLEKQGDQWWLTEPVKGWADKDAVERMVKALAELKPTGSRKGENPSDAKWGLDKPKLTATLNTKGGQYTIHLGNQITGGSEYFARIDGRDQLYFVPASLQSDLSQQPDALRDKALTHLEKDKLVAVTLQYPDRVLAVEKRGTTEKPQWLLTQPYEAKADEWAAKQIADKLADLKAEGFAPDKPAAGQSYGFDKPTLKATIKREDGKEQVFTFGARSKQVITDAATSSAADSATPKDIVYVQVEGRPEVLMVLDTSLVDLQKTDMEVRDKRILEVERDQIWEVRVERKKGVAFSAKRSGPDAWALSSPVTEAANKDKINDLLWDLDELEATEFLGEQQDLKQYGLALPDTVVTLTVKGQENQPIKVSIGYEKQDGLYYAKTSQSNQVYVISDMLLQDLPKSLDELKASTAATGTMPPGAGNPPPAIPSQ